MRASEIQFQRENEHANLSVLSFSLALLFSPFSVLGRESESERERVCARERESASERNQE